MSGHFLPALRQQGPGARATGNTLQEAWYLSRELGPHVTSQHDTRARS